MSRYYSVDERRVIDDDVYEAHRRGWDIAPLLFVSSLILFVLVAISVINNQAKFNANRLFDQNGGQVGVGGGPPVTPSVTLTPTTAPTPRKQM